MHDDGDTWNRMAYTFSWETNVTYEYTVWHEVDGHKSLLLTTKYSADILVTIFDWLELRDVFAPPNEIVDPRRLRNSSPAMDLLNN